MNEITELLLSQSFPIAVAVFLLVRLEAKIDSLENVLADLSKNIHLICYKEKNKPE